MVKKMSAKKCLENSMCKTDIWETQFSEEYLQLLIVQTCCLLIEKRTACRSNLLGHPVSVCWWAIDQHVKKRGMQLRHYILILVILFFLSVKSLPCRIICLFDPFILMGNDFRKLAQNFSWIQCRWLGVLHRIGRSHDAIFVALIRVFLIFGISCSNDEIGYPHLVLWDTPEPINENFNMIDGSFMILV